MARKSGRQEVTTEPVSDYDYDDAPSGGIDLATALAIFTFLFILAGIIVTYMELTNKYDVGKEQGDPSIYKPFDPRLGPDTAEAPEYEDDGGDEEGGADEGAGDEGGADEGGMDEGGGDEGGGEDDGFDDE